MDYTHYLQTNYMLLGNYDRKSPPLINKRLKLLNKVAFFASSFCALKALVICLDFFTVELFRSYLTEVYLAKGKAQKIFDLGLSGLHAGAAYRFYYCSKHLNTNMTIIKHLDFFFISDLDELLSYYNLEREPTEKFLKKAKYYKQFMDFFILCFEVFFSGLVSRCVIFYTLPTVSKYYFFTIGLLLFFVTIYSYHLISTTALKTYLLIFLSIEFLILRMNKLEKIILKEFNKKTYARLKITKVKRSSKTFEVLRQLNGFAVDFKHMDQLCNHLQSLTTFGALVSAFAFPYLLVFSENVFLFKLFVFILYVSALIVICSSVSWYNDHFKKKFNRLVLVIHHCMPMYAGLPVKLSFDNFLTLNDEHQGGFAFTFLNLRKYSSIDMIEYTLQVLAMMFMLYQAFGTNLNALK